MTTTVVLRTSALVFAVAMLQTVIVSSLVLGGGAPDLLLVVVIALGLLRGSVTGAVAGFASGFVVDVLALGTLGITSLTLTLAGFWAGRYAETTGRGRRLAPIVAVGVITVLAAVFGVVLHFMLGEAVAARHALVTALIPALVANLVLALPIYALVRSIVGDRTEHEPAQEVELVV